jgi:hypothetical protein
MLRTAALALIGLAGCTDLSGFVGDWKGGPVSDPLLLAGLAPQAEVALHLDGADRVALRGTLEVAGERVALRPLTRAGNDALGALDLPDQPIKSYLLVAPLEAGDALVVVSLYGDQRVDVRLVRSDTLYAVCHLQR